jgi:clan AA aspartic protease (TIGR02281 family)
MKFGPAEMAQTMEAAKALITVSMISFVGIGLVLGVIVALFVAFFQRGLHRNRAEPLTNGPLLTPNSSPGPNTVYPGRPPSMCDQLAREHTSIGNDIIPDNRINRSDERIFPFRLSILLLIVAFGGGVLYGQYAWQRSDTPPKPEAPQRADTPQRPDLLLRAGYTEIYSMLGISPLPEAVETNASIRRPLEQLSRERCDQQAIAELGVALDKLGYRREAATAQVSYSATCGGHAPSLRAAVNILLRLSDYPTAVTVASNLIKLEPFYDNGYYLRAVAYDRSGSFKKAIDDYITAIELFGNKDRIASVSYFGMARSYEKLGQFCDAVLPIEAWVSLNPTRNDTSQTRAIITDYMAKGRCETATTSGGEKFAISRQTSVVKLPVAVNGVRGNFVLDTGATFVSLKNEFAQKAKVQIDKDSTVRLHTANGPAEGKRGRAATIQLRSLQAKDVAVVVQNDGQATYGEDIDGLLGMSFLSRFNVTIDTQAVRISNRSSR